MTQDKAVKPFFRKLEKMGNFLVDSYHILALFLIGFTVIWSTGVEFLNIIQRGSASLKDILLLFIYLEIGAMLGIYFKTKKLPVIFLIYIAITALTRVLAVDIKNMDGLKALSLTGAILILAVSGFVLSMSKPKWLDTDKQNPE